MAGVRRVGENKLTSRTYRTECIHHFVIIKLISLNNTEIQVQ